MSSAAFYESLLGFGPPLLEPRTVEMMGAVHRYDLRDAVFGFAANLGPRRAPSSSAGGTGRRVFGHGGMASSRGLADPDCGLVAVVVCNGLPNPIAAEQRLFEVTDAVYTALGDLAARVPADVSRQIARASVPLAMTSSIRAWTAGGAATMSPDCSQARSSPCQSVTTPPASRTSSAAGGDVPGAEGLLEVAVEHPGRGPGEVEARGARPGAGPRT